MWALSYYLTQLSLDPRSSCQQTPRELETRCGREGYTRPRGTLETPEAVASRIPDSRDQMWLGRPHPTEGALGKAPMEWTPRPLVEHLREQERHNVTVIIVGSKYEVYVRSPAKIVTINNKITQNVSMK